MITNELVEQVRKGDIQTRNKLIEHYSYIITWVCNKFYHMPFDKDTIRYGAIMGLMKAIENFDERKGKFNRYAYLCARNVAKNEISKDWIVKIPSETLYKSLSKGEIPYEKVDIYKIKKEYRGRQVAYCPPELMCHDTHKDKDYYEVINNVLNDLKPMEKDCILYKYCNSGLTLKEIAQKHQVSYEWIRLSIPRAFKKFKIEVKRALNKE